MIRNFYLALGLTIALFVVYNVLPFPWKCTSAGCVADIARRWNSISFGAQVARFFLPWIAAFVTLQWIAPWSGRVRHRARMRLWHGYRE